MLTALEMDFRVTMPRATSSSLLSEMVMAEGLRTTSIVSEYLRLAELRRGLLLVGAAIGEAMLDAEAELANL